MSCSLNRRNATAIIGVNRHRAGAFHPQPKWQQTEFEGPIEKLIEKYKDLEEVKRHLTLGQAMKYEFTADGSVLDQKGNVIFDGEKLVKPL
jgi:hypothetical protein